LRNKNVEKSEKNEDIREFLCLWRETGKGMEEEVEWREKNKEEDGPQRRRFFQ
jgi:hypothetical protein